ncbi:MAG: L,D-transpeptidase [Hyphomicrobiaceae bacterium]
MKFPIYLSVAVASLMLSGTVSAYDISAKLPPIKLTKIAAVDTTKASDVDVKKEDVVSNDDGVVETKPKKVKAVKPKPVATTLVAAINLSNQTLTVKEYGKVKYTWAISSGRSGYRTPTGTYRPKWMSKMHYSRKYDNAPMPHSVFFHGGYAIHATYAISRLGAPASHGCIRLAPKNARKFFKLVQKHKMAGTRVKLHGVAKDTKRSYAKKKKKIYKAKKYSSYNKSTFNYKWSFAPKKYNQTSYVWPGDRPRVRKRRHHRNRGY